MVRVNLLKDVKAVQEACTLRRVARESRINVCEEKVEASQDRSVCCVEHLSVSIKWALGNLDWMLPNLCLQGEGW